MGFPLGDGYHVLPPGKLAAVVTWLEMREPPKAGEGLPEGVALIHDPEPEVSWYCRIFREIGEPWLWFGRLEMSAEELGKILTAKGIEVYRLETGGDTIGLLEMDRRHPEEVEITYFGLVPGWTGRGVGKALMAEALRQAWTPGTGRVWLHTCSFDHPGAVSFYQKCGFRPYQRGLEIFDDPRLRGVVRKDAAAQVPLL
ncbi:MAG: GNAT family N-acetyltransferase [Acidobacteriota bacterium]